MVSTSVYGLEVLVLEGSGGKALATDHRVCKDFLTSENIRLIDALWSRGSFVSIQKPLVMYGLKSSNFEFAAATETQHVLFHPIFNHVGLQTECSDPIFGGFFYHCF